MLNRLDISNYALIENVSLKLNPGFTVITGETGAGKSIILEALNLLLGERADTSVIRQNENKCVLEAEFDISNLDLQDFFKAHDLDFDNSCIARREFSTNGKSRCFVNDTPVQLSVLKELGERLISIHSQHQTLQLFDPVFQLDLLDHFAGIQADVKSYRTIYHKYRQKVNERIELEVKERESRKEKDYLEFLLKELEDAKPEENDPEELQNRYHKIENAEKINESLRYARSVFENENIGPFVALNTLIETLEELKQFDSVYAGLSGRLSSVKIELKDIESELNNLSGETDFDPEEIQLVKDKVEQLNSLLYKHNLRSVSQLIDLKNSMAQQLGGIQSVEDQLGRISKEISVLQNDLKSRSKSISTARIDAIEGLSDQVEEKLRALAMPDAILKVGINDLGKPGPNGSDEVEFLFKTNLGGNFAPLKKIASGGELSRLMLCLLSILAKTKSLPVLIFDEIDTGVSGEVAAKMANEFQKIGSFLQIIVITHLAQVAGKGSNHLHVNKQHSGNKTITTVTVLEGEQRVEQLAKMISGETVTDAAKENAKALLKSA